MKAIIFALLTSLMWGIAPVFFKLALKGGLNPIIALVFHNLSGFILASIFLVITQNISLNFSLKEIIFVALGGMTSGFLGVFFFFNAVREGHISVVAPIASVAPLWGALIAFLFLGEALSWLRVFGILLVVCGIVLISLSSK